MIWILVCYSFLIQVAAIDTDQAAQVYLTGIRPGSFTVSKGYEKGAPLGDGSMHRTEDETLRWSDVEFRRTERGLVVR